MSKFKFSIQQILLLTMLVALIAGLYSTALRQPAKNIYKDGCVSPDGRHLAMFGTQGVEIIDVERGQVVAKERWQGSAFFFFGLSLFGDSTIAFVDDDHVAFEKMVLDTTGSFNVYKYSIPDREISEKIAVSALSLGNGGLFGKYHMVRDAATQVIEVTDIKTSQSISKGKFLAPLESKSGLSPDARYVYFYQRDFSNFGQVVAPMKMQVFDRESRKSVGELDANAVRVAFSPDSKRVVVEENYTLRCFEITDLDSTSDESAEDETVILAVEDVDDGEDVEAQGETALPTETIDASDKGTDPNAKVKFTELWSAKVPDGTAHLAFSDDGKIVSSVQSWGDERFKLFDAGTGEILTSYECPGAGDVCRLLDSENVVLAPADSDSKFEIRDLSGNVVRSFGGNWRAAKAIMYCGLLLLWPISWGLISHRQRTSFRSNESRSDDPLKEGATGDADGVHVVAEVVAPVVPWTIKTVWVLMVIGGTIAIVWAAFPMFFFQNGFIGNLMSPTLSVFRYAFAGIGLSIGLLAASRGIGRSRNYLNFTSMLQIFCIVNLDIFNFVIGITNIAFLNQSVTHSFLAQSDKVSRD